MVFDDIRDKIDDKLEEIEQDLDEDEIPPWTGEKKTTDNKDENDFYELNENDEVTVIDIFIPDSSSEEDVSINKNENILEIDILGESFDFEYEIERDEPDIDAKFYTDENKLKIRIEDVSGDEDLN